MFVARELLLPRAAHTLLCRLAPRALPHIIPLEWATIQLTNCSGRTPNSGSFWCCTVPVHHPECGGPHLRIAVICIKIHACEIHTHACNMTYTCQATVIFEYQFSIKSSRRSWWNKMLECGCSTVHVDPTDTHSISSSASLGQYISSEL